MQAPAPTRLIEGGLPTEAMVAQVLVSKYADHLPLYRQAQIYARQGITLDRSTLADWVGRAAFLLRPVYERLFMRLKSSAKLFADETTAPVLDPGRGRTKTGQLWAYARDDRPWGGRDPPGVAYVYAPDRKAERPITHLTGFKGVLQVDGYSGYRALAARGDVALAFCWAHVRRRFYELAVAGPAPIASEALQRIAELYAVETEARGRSPDERRALRQTKSRPLLDAFEPWLRAKLDLISQKTGDLGRPICNAQVPAPGSEEPAVDAEQQRITQETEAARTSRLFATTNARERPATRTPLAAATIEDRKLAFLTAAVDRKTVSPDRLVNPASRYVVQAGAVTDGLTQGAWDAEIGSRTNSTRPPPSRLAALGSKPSTPSWSGRAEGTR